ncbi:MAG TPA: SusD/RagB family nutrient-binding outer membrane lipoprotein [Cyclobacteriaceae bacterium]|nr:SusD/RagB family nutrient-binding outer membrane lipoprotein [Cyclobacteriaceae bacterium]
MKIKNIATLILFVTLFFSCEDLTDLNQNPNGVEPNNVNPNLVMSTVLTESAKAYVNLGYGIVGGVMQHTQKDGWWGDHNDYEWSNQSWTTYYAILEDNKLVYDRSVELGYEFHQGVSLVMKSFMFGLITDLWGDAPYTSALKGEELGENLRPTFDSQESIYDGILADLETANTLLSSLEFEGIVDDVDVIYGGDPTAWRKFANSLMLRYYMRISDKKPAIGKAGIEKIVNDPAQYPIITSSDDDAAMSFPGTSTDTAWPNNVVFDASQSNFSRIKMAATLVEKLQSLSDPRLGVWAAKVKIPLVVDAGLPSGTDEIVEIGGKEYRYMSPDVVGTTPIDTDPEYVGLPTSLAGLPVLYNFNPSSNQGAYNPHVSQLNDIYKQATGPLLKARLISAAEVNFILAEAALKGWNVGDAQSYYEAGVITSMETWGVDDDYDTYIAEVGVAYDGTLEQLMEQKWIASWTSATESWFDYRRTGLPALVAGPAGKRTVLPVRFYYMTDELRLNETNTTSALELLEITSYSQADAENSAWSKPWLIQGTGKPW